MVALMDTKKRLQIGNVARRAGTTIRTVRYYLEEGFIQACERSLGGFYLFSPDVVDKVSFIQKLTSLGMPLKEIKTLYRIRKEHQTGNDAYGLVLEQLMKERDLMDQKIKEYMQLRDELDQAILLVSKCKGCSLRPTRENCIACDIVTRRSRIPLPFGAIL